MSGISQIIFGAPVTAVNEKNNGMRIFALCGKSHLDKLVWVWAICQPLIGIRRFCAENVLAWHRQAV
jgi:hypothetical protein